MNALSLRQAQSCENATGPACECRCGGLFHGKARVADTRTLPLDDAHSPSRECEKCGGTGERRWYSYALVPMKTPCLKCEGKGRYITGRVKNQPLPNAAESSEADSDQVPAA